MKISTLLLCFLFTTVLKIYAQCNPYFQLSEKDIWEYATYGPQNQLLNTITASHDNIAQTPEGWTVQMKYTYKDARKSLVFEGDIKVDCIDGIVHTDFARLISAEELKAAEENDSDINSASITWPDSLTIGDKLKDASLDLDAGSMKVSYSMTNRKVVSKDTLSLSVGTFVCFKVEYALKILGLTEQKFQGVDYITERFGVLRTEYYDKNGELVRYTEMTKFTGD